MLLLCLLIPFSISCGLSRQDTERFANAGKAYTTAMDILLTRSGELCIDANSEFTIYKDEQANIKLKEYTELRDADRERIKVIARLKSHTKLLARYFELLLELSTSNEPENTATALTGLVGSLRKAGNDLRGSSIFTAAATAAVSNLGRLLVTVRIKRSLENELSNRNGTIRQELVTQEQLLKILADDISHNLRVVTAAKESRLVISPIRAASPLASQDVDKWKSNRKAAIIAENTIDELTDASDAIENLRIAYESLLSGKFNIARVNEALDEFETIITTAESIKEIIGENK